MQKIKNKKIVFLSGPMRGVLRKNSISWRKKATKNLENIFIVLHAYRGREKKETFSDPRGAVIRDKQDIQRCDLMIVDDTVADASMIGTAMEVFFANSLNIPIIVFGDAHKNDYWLNAHLHIRVDSLENACDVAKTLFNI